MKEISQSFGVITATGKENAISDTFKDKHIFKGVHLINMGVHDEYGRLFDRDEVIFDKQGINFSLSEPTLLKYIDPVFYAHNLGVELLLSGKYQAGYYPFPKELDDQIVNRWQVFHDETL